MALGTCRGYEQGYQYHLVDTFSSNSDISLCLSPSVLRLLLSLSPRRISVGAFIGCSTWVSLLLDSNVTVSLMFLQNRLCHHLLWRLAIITPLLKSDRQALRDMTQTSVDGAGVLCQVNAPSQSDRREEILHLVCYEGTYIVFPDFESCQLLSSSKSSKRARYENITFVIVTRSSCMRRGLERNT